MLEFARALNYSLLQGLVQLSELGFTFARRRFGFDTFSRLGDDAENACDRAVRIWHRGV